MSRNNRIQQPYGYREQNNLTTEPAMICNAITSGSASSKEIIEKINYILYNGFFGVNYDKGLDSYAFTNSLGNLIGAAKLEDIAVNQLIQEVGYNQEDKKIFLTLENGETIEIPLEALVNQVSDLVAEETAIRKEEDNKLWDAISGSSSGDTNLRELIEQEISDREKEDQKIWNTIGEMTESGSSLVDLIKQEESARTDSDQNILDRIAQEESSRTEEDQKIWDAISGSSSGYTDLRELIEQEISARTDGDVALRHDLGEEIVARSQGDAAILRAVDEEKGNRIAEDDAIKALISGETESREAKDNEILSALSAETEARESGDTAIGKRIDDEKAARLYWDNQLSGTVLTEKQEREAKDNEILSALSAETQARKDVDSGLTDSINQEKIDRAREDGILSGAVVTEREEREAKDSEIIGIFEGENLERKDADRILSGSIDTEILERKAADRILSGSITDERAERKAADEAFSGAIEDNVAKIYKVTTGIPSNVRERYELKNALGERMGTVIDVYNDSTLKSAELTDWNPKEDRGGQFLKLVYGLEDGTEDTVYIDFSTFLVESEFKDGLISNSAGEVRVKIDSASETYLTVSEHGVRLSGVTAIEQRLTRESTVRANTDITLGARIDTEEGRATSAETELRNLIIDEAQLRENNDGILSGKITAEISDRESEVRRVEGLISNETSDRMTKDETLYSLITANTNSLNTEKLDRINADQGLQTKINSLESADTEIRNSINSLSSGLITEKEEREENVRNLVIEIGRKADSEQVYYQDYIDGHFATKEEIPTDFYTKSEVDAKDAEISSSLTNEVDTREAEDVKLNNIITAETQNREIADQNLQDQIDSLQDELNVKVVEVKAKDNSVTVDSADATKPKVKVNISTEVEDGNPNIIKLNNDGIYAKADLTYDEEINRLIFSNTVGTKNIDLKTKSSIDNIYYDKPNESIVIEYTVNGTRKEDVHVPVHDLIQEWDTSEDTSGAIKLDKEIHLETEDVLKARLLLNTTHDDNAAVIDSNSLYVSKNGITAEVNEKIAALEGRVAALEAALQTAQQEHITQSEKIASVEQVNSTQDDKITEIETKNQSQDERILQLMGYHESEINP